MRQVCSGSEGSAGKRVPHLSSISTGKASLCIWPCLSNQVQRTSFFSFTSLCERTHRKTVCPFTDTIAPTGKSVNCGSSCDKCGTPKRLLALRDVFDCPHDRLFKCCHCKRLIPASRRRLYQCLQLLCHGLNSFDLLHVFCARLPVCRSKGVAHLKCLLSP